MEFKGGTYISQVNAEHLIEALAKWGKQSEPNEIKHLGIKGKSEIITQLEEIELTNIRGMKNVWFSSLSIKNGFITFNVVKTSKPKS
jgi:hypothetical protein